jgi:hypothetical protein
MNHGEEHETRVDGPIPDRAVRVLLSQDNSAGPTIALSTAFFDTLVRWKRPKIIEDRRSWSGARGILEINRFELAVKQK